MSRTGVEKLVAELGTFQIENVFNPYSQVCTIHDLPNAQTIRKLNLCVYLDHVLLDNPKYLLIGEALGYRGGRRTGLPFTDEKQLLLLQSRIQLEKATKTQAMGEVTASVVWQIIRTLDKPPLMWNIFPFHPMGRTFLSNRKPKSKEIRSVIHIMDQISELAPQAEILAIGKSAYNALVSASIPSTYIRHPSHGGANIFRKQMQNYID